MNCPPEISICPYEQLADEQPLWECKQAFERELGAKTGDSEKADIYDSKLTTTYHDRWVAWVNYCVRIDPGCIAVAVIDDHTEMHDSTEIEKTDEPSGNQSHTRTAETQTLAGYAFYCQNCSDLSGMQPYLTNYTSVHPIVARGRRCIV